MSLPAEVNCPQSPPSPGVVPTSRKPFRAADMGGDMTTDQAYSWFSPLQKRFLAYVASISATFSGLSSFIYYPAITAVAHSLCKTTEAINLTVTAYLVMFDIAPSFLGDLADRMGKHPVTYFALALYLGGNLGLALWRNYAALLVLRCLQSAGASSTTALAYGIISDISTPSERGPYVAVLMVIDRATLCPSKAGLTDRQSRVSQIRHPPLDLF